MQLGDIMLVRGMGVISASLSPAQKLIYSKSRSSHVIFCLSYGCFIHSAGVGGGAFDVCIK